MTREEAIAFFKDMNECTYGNLEAVEMAIQALSQECVGSTQKYVGNALEMRCDDAVSRQLSAKDYLDMADEKAKKIKDALIATQKSGKWIDINGIYAKCSNCNEEIYITGDFKFCPNCGARMESDRE